MLTTEQERVMQSEFERGRSEQELRERRREYVLKNVRRAEPLVLAAVRLSGIGGAP